MSYFALVTANDGKQFSIKHCHINFWSLPGLIKRKLFFDVGFHIVAIDDGVKNVDVALPFAAESLADVSSPLHTRETSQLIFRNESVKGRISFADAKDIEIFSINEDDSKAAKKQEKNRSLWHISIPEMSAGKERYFRVRFTVKNCGRMWNAKRHLFLNYGALLDFRVADTREVPGDPVWDGVRERIVPISELNFFVIAPLTLQMQNASPLLYTSRVLEGDSWEPYLRRKTRGERMIIYQWNKNYPEANDPITTVRPYRVFLDLSKEVISVSIPAAIQSAIVTSAIIALIIVLLWQGSSHVNVAAMRSAWLKYIAGLTVVGVLTWVASKVEFMKRVFSKVPQILEALDKWRYART
jgi:hypothetical protein